MANSDFIIKDGVLTKYQGTSDELVIPGNIEKIGKEAFYEANVKKVIIEDGVKEIGKSAFCGCGHLAEILLPKTLEIIEYDAFCACGLLKEIVLPDSLIKIGKAPFTMCDSLEKIVINSNKSFKSADKKLFSKDGKKLIWYSQCCLDKEYLVPDGIEVICEAAFANNDHIERIVLPNGVKKIGGDAFGKCKKLKEVVIPASVTRIEDELDGLGTFSHVHPILPMLGIMPPTIYAPLGSYAIKYAEEKNIPFVAL